MTLEDRVAALEGRFLALLEGLHREGTIQDGNWGYPSTRQTIHGLLIEMRDDAASNRKEEK